MFFRILQDFNPSIIPYFSNPHGFIRILSDFCGPSPNFSILRYSFNSLGFYEFFRMFVNSFEFPTTLLDCVCILSDSLGVSRILSNSSEFSCILCEFARILWDSFKFLCIPANPSGFFRVLSNSSGFSRIPKNSSRIFANYVEFLLILSGSIAFSDSSGFIEFCGIFLDSLAFFHFLSDYFVFPRILSNRPGF